MTIEFTKKPEDMRKAFNDIIKDMELNEKKERRNLCIITMVIIIVLAAVIMSIIFFGWNWINLILSICPLGILVLIFEYELPDLRDSIENEKERQDDILTFQERYQSNLVRRMDIVGASYLYYWYSDSGVIQKASIPITRVEQRIDISVDKILISEKEVVYQEVWDENNLA